MPEVEGPGSDLTRKGVVALAAVLVPQAFFALCLVSALQLLVPRNTPFGMVGSSQVVAQAQSTAGLDIISYSSEAGAMDAINQGTDLYGAYVTGSASDTLIVVPARVFSPGSSWRPHSLTPPTS